MENFSKIKQKFDADFEAWGIRLVPEKLTPNARGKIQEAGWTIEYLFSANEKGAYLDYYAAHRMTNDRHQRIYADGSVVELPALTDMFVSREEGEFVQGNREIGAMLKAKGFGAQSD